MDHDLINLNQEGDNPYSGIQSFDNIYYAALQVVVVTSANGVRVLYPYFCRANTLSVVLYHVLDHRRRVFRLLLLFHRLHPRIEHLAYQSIRRRDHEHVLCHTCGYAEECLWCCTVRFLTFYTYADANVVPISQARACRRRARRGLGRRETRFSEQLTQGVLYPYALVLGISGSRIARRTSHRQC